MEWFISGKQAHSAKSNSHRNTDEGPGDCIPIADKEDDDSGRYDSEAVHRASKIIHGIPNTAQREPGGKQIPKGKLGNRAHSSHEFNSCLIPYFRGDLSGNIFYDHSPPSTDSRRAGVSYKGKFVHKVLGSCLVKLAQEKCG